VTVFGVCTIDIIFESRERQALGPLFLAPSLPSVSLEGWGVFCFDVLSGVPVEVFISSRLETEL
jgi:hypothetical protein